jgi:hypothetical protein
MENPSVITAAVLAVCKQWHGTIDQQFSCIDNVVERSERCTDGRREWIKPLS